MSPETGAAPARPAGQLEDCNLLVSFSSRAPGQARREVRGRLRALGDPEPVTVPTLSRGLLAARTSLDPRAVIRELRALGRASPDVFRQTTRWVPVDAWTAPDLEAMRQAVSLLAGRIGPGETWRMTVDKRAGAVLDPAEVIRHLAALIEARVDLARPDRILLVELFGDRTALAVLAPDDILSVATLRAVRGQAGDAAGTGSSPG